MNKRQVLRSAHVVFNEFTKPPEIQGEDSNFEYATLDFAPPGEYKSHKPTEQSSNTQIGNQPPVEVIIAEMEDVELDEPEMPPPPVPTATASAEPPTPCLSIQNASQPQADYAQVNNPWNSYLGSQGNKDPGNKQHSHGFAGKVKKTRTINLDYYIPNNWKEVLVHPDKDKYII